MGFSALAARVRSTPVDLLLALGFTLAGLAQTLVAPIAPHPVGELFVLGTTLPVAWRRTLPIAASAVSAAFWLLPTQGYPLLGFIVAVLIFFALGTHGKPLRNVVGVTIWAVATSVVGTLLGPEPPVALIGSVLVVVAPVVAGLLVARQRSQNATLQRLTAELAEERERVREASVGAERARIAQELHDVIGHELTLIAIQAEAASSALTLAPDRVGEPVEAIRTTAHRALQQMRHVVDVLDVPVDGASRPGPAALQDLVARAAGQGVPAELHVTGVPWRDQPGVWLSLERVARECLTNAGKHAPGAPVELEMVRPRGMPDRHQSDPGVVPAPAEGPPVRCAWSGGHRPPGGAARWAVAYRSRGRMLRRRGGAATTGGAAVTTVLVVDDEALVRQGLRMILELGGVSVREAADGEEAVAAVAADAPDVVLMDLRMPRLDGVEATRRIAASSPVPVLVLTTFDHDENLVAALRAGAAGFLLKDATGEQLLDAVRRTAAGEPVVAPQVLSRLVQHYAEDPPTRARSAPSGLAELSDREREVLVLIAEGLSNAEIAAGLVVSMATVKSHVRHIFAKLDLRDRAQAVVVAHDAGLRKP